MCSIFNNRSNVLTDVSFYNADNNEMVEGHDGAENWTFRIALKRSHVDKKQHGAVRIYHFFIHTNGFRHLFKLCSINV